MKVLHLVKTGVGATWALRQMRELVRAGIDVAVAVPPGPLLPRYRDVGVRVHEIDVDFPARRPLELPGRLRRLRRLVELERPDLVHSHFVGPTLTLRLALGRRSQLPRLFQVPSPLHLEHALFRNLDLATAGAADRWIATCRKTRELYREAGVGDERLSLSYYGFDVDDWRATARGGLRAELGVPASAPVVGMVAHVYAPKRYLGQRRGLKGHEDFIDAVALAARARPAMRGVIVGGPWAGAARYEQRVRRYGRRYCPGHVVFLGHRDDVARLYADMDVAVHPSHAENVGGAAESSLAEVPTVATDVGGFPDIIEPGVTGWLVPPRDPPGLARAIAMLLDDPARARVMAAEARRRAERMLDVRRTAAEIGALYERVLARSPGERTS